jgi:hypothetical protein
VGSFAIATAAFLFGYSSAGESVRPGRLPMATIETKTELALQARVLRSGDRGVLIYAPGANRVRLLRWDDIVEIDKNL